jgi:hypothetical protein
LYIDLVLMLLLSILYAQKSNNYAHILQRNNRLPEKQIQNKYAIIGLSKAHCIISPYRKSFIHQIHLKQKLWL